MPYLELLERERVRGLRWVKINAQLAMAGDAAFVDLYPEPSAAILAEFRRAFPEVPEDRLLLRWSVASRTLIQMLSHADRWTARRFAP